MQWYQAERGNPAAVRHWIEEYRRRLRQQEKGNVPEETARHMGYALNLATVGLHEEAIAELNTMLAQPGGFSFVFVSPVAGTGVDLLVTSAPPGESA